MVALFRLVAKAGMFGVLLAVLTVSYSAAASDEADAALTAQRMNQMLRSRSQTRTQKPKVAPRFLDRATLHPAAVRAMAARKSTPGASAQAARPWTMDAVSTFTFPGFYVAPYLDARAPGYWQPSMASAVADFDGVNGPDIACLEMGGPLCAGTNRHEVVDERAIQWKE